jgi:hypothetical protein
VAGRKPEARQVAFHRPRAASPGSGAAICAGTSADSGILSRTRKIFFKNVFRRKGYPLLGQKPFLGGFSGDGA